MFDPGFAAGMKKLRNCRKDCVYWSMRWWKQKLIASNLSETVGAADYEVV